MSTCWYPDVEGHTHHDDDAPPADFEVLLPIVKPDPMDRLERGVNGRLKPLREFTPGDCQELQRRADNAAAAYLETHPGMAARLIPRSRL